MNSLCLLIGSSNRTIWRLSGNQGQQWLQGQAPIPVLKTSYKVIFEGVRGRSYTGDIAIDDITFTGSTCGGTLTHMVALKSILTVIYMI